MSAEAPVAYLETPDEPGEDPALDFIFEEASAQAAPLAEVIDITPRLPRRGPIAVLPADIEPQGEIAVIKANATDFLASNATFDEIFKRYKKAVRGVAYGMTNSEDASQEIAQKAFIKLWDSVDKLDPEYGSVAGYLLRTAHNLSLNHIRDRKRRRTVSTEDLSPPERAKAEQKRFPGSTMSDGDMLDQITIRDALLHALEFYDQIPENYQEAWAFSVLGGLGPQELAEIWDITPGAAKVRTHRARKAFEKALEEAGVEYPGRDSLPAVAEA